MKNLKTQYELWKQFSLAFKAFEKYDNEVYKAIGDKVWHSDPINENYGEVWNQYMGTFLTFLSEGKETSYSKLYDRFESPGGATGKKPVAWYKTSYNDGETYKVRKGYSGFIPECFQEAFKDETVKGFETAKGMYKDLVDIETKWRTNETKTRSTKRKNKVK